MLLVSYEFLFFLFLLMVFYYLIPGQFQWILLLCASLLFYLSGGAGGILYLLITIFSVWILAQRIEKITVESRAYIKEQGLKGDEKKLYNRACKKQQRKWMIAGLILNFGILAVIKYSNFAIFNINNLLHVFGSGTEFARIDWIFPLGISYYTFQSMGYLIDIYYRKYEAEKNIGRFALFVSFFPQMISGPVSRFDELKSQLYERHSFRADEIKLGLSRILWGYFKKLVVADRIAPVVAAISQAPDDYTGIYVLIGMLSYTLQMYADFTGGIDIVIGAAQLFGIHLPENFNRPFFSKNLAEFWRRWHMSLMRWFREYIFFPVSTGQTTQKISLFIGKYFGKTAGKKTPIYVGMIVVWFITGIWHGASWNFIAWGMANCVVMLASQELEPLYHIFHEKHSWSNTRGYQYFEIVRTFLLFCTLEMFEYYPFKTVFVKFWEMLTESRLSQLWDGTLAGFGLLAADWAVLAGGILVMLWVSMQNRFGSVRLQIAQKEEVVRYALHGALLLAVLILGVYGQGYDASQFIYNQF